VEEMYQTMSKREEKSIIIKYTEYMDKELRKQETKKEIKHSGYGQSK